MLALTAFINICAALVIRGKERTSLHAAMVCDCFVNILIMATHVLAQSPWFRLGSAEACNVFTFYCIFLLTWNRLIPVAIATYRYLMVCHAIRCHNFGGEGKIWRVLNSLILGFCLARASVVSATSSTSLSYLRCINREETFRRTQLTDFYEPLEDGGVQFSGPLLGPLRLFHNIAVNMFAFLVPLLYGALFIFRRKNATNIPGSWKK